MVIAIAMGVVIQLQSLFLEFGLNSHEAIDLVPVPGILCKCDTCVLKMWSRAENVVSLM